MLSEPYRLQQTKQYVGVDGAFVSLIQHDDVVLCQISVDQALPKHHSLCHVFDFGLRTRTILETNRVPHLLAKFTIMGLNFLNLLVYQKI